MESVEFRRTNQVDGCSTLAARVGTREQTGRLYLASLRKEGDAL